MSKLYKAKVNTSFEFEVTEANINALDVIKTSDKQYHILQDNQSYKAHITSANYNNRIYTISINGNSYDVAITNELDQLIKDMGFEIGASKQVNEIKAPMPGLILDVAVEIGQNIKANDSLLILEAMKMENNIVSPRDGVIKSISISKGDAVEKNQLLIAFE